MISTWHSLDAEAEEVASTTEQQMPEVCVLLRHGISVLADGFTEVDVTRIESAEARMGLCSQNLNSLKCCTDLAMRGYYTQSLGLLRGVHENRIAFLYITKFPLKADCWVQSGGRPPKHSAMLKALGPDFNGEKTTAHLWYRELCRVAHTDAVVVRPHLGSYNGAACAFWGVMFKPALFRACAYAISRYVGIMLSEISLLIKEDADWQRRCCTSMEELLKFVQQESDDYQASMGTGKANNQS